MRFVGVVRCPHQRGKDDADQKSEYGAAVEEKHVRPPSPLLPSLPRRNLRLRSRS